MSTPNAGQGPNGKFLPGNRLAKGNPMAGRVEQFRVVDRKIEKFLNDYYHANPKQPVRPTTQPAGKK